MGLIRKKLALAGSLGREECQVLFDTGASACFVREDVARRLSPILKAPVPLSFTLGDKTTFTAEYTTVLQADIDGHALPHMFLVVPKLPYEVILGADFLQRWKIKLDPATEEFIIDEEALRIVLV
ncbi:MAG: retropepsin-like aspartic protease [Anaerolineae bacterium]|nr:retropepsin-like aspartic protease [Anaerolineae bacterium]